MTHLGEQIGIPVNEWSRRKIGKVALKLLEKFSQNSDFKYVAALPQKQRLFGKCFKNASEIPDN
jgi:hypothetical protein